MYKSTLKTLKHCAFPVQELIPLLSCTQSPSAHLTQSLLCPRHFVRLRGSQRGVRLSACPQMPHIPKEKADTYLVVGVQQIPALIKKCGKHCGAQGRKALVINSLLSRYQGVPNKEGDV